MEELLTYLREWYLCSVSTTEAASARPPTRACTRGPCGNVDGRQHGTKHSADRTITGVRRDVIGPPADHEVPIAIERAV
jgi:hypothetical protein